MSATTRKTFLKGQVLEMDRLLELSADDPLMGPGLRSRKAELEQELETLPAENIDPRATLYFYGEPVNGSYGIDAEFAAKALTPFVGMVKAQYIADKHGGVAARGRMPNEAEARLLLTGLPRGSVGFELSPPPMNQPDLFAEKRLTDVLGKLTKLVRAAGADEEGFAEALEEISSRAFQQLGAFLEVVASRHASLRLLAADQVCELDQAHVARASGRVRQTATREQDLQKTGVFRGATLESWRFDFRSDEGEVFSGWIADLVTDEQANEMNALTNRRSVATLHEITFTTPGGQIRRQLELLSLAAAPGG